MLETLPLACHDDADSGVPASGVVERRSSPRGSQWHRLWRVSCRKPVLTNVQRGVCREWFFFVARDMRFRKRSVGKRGSLSSLWPVVMVAVTTATITVTSIRSRSRSSSLSSPSAPPHYWWSCLLLGWSCLLFGVALFSFSAVLFTCCVVLFTFLAGPV